MLVSNYISSIERKVESGEDLDVDDIIFMYDEADVNDLGKLARKITEKISGNRVSFVSNIILNYTNVCNVRCKFCAFYRTGKEPDAYTMTPDQVIEEIRKYYPLGIRQVLIQGGVNPNLDLDYYIEVFRRIRKEFPDVGINGLSTAEINFISRKARMSYEDTISILREAGLETIPGAGAEILDEDIRVALGRPAGSGRQWLEIMETAHRIGVRTSATMVYGHIEKSVNKAHHLIAIRDLQKKYHGFLSFTAWNMEPDNTQLQREGVLDHRSQAEDVIRNVAISRIVLNYHLPIIQSSWLTNGVEMGQLAILYGSNDWGGTIYDERVIPATGKNVGNLHKEIIIRSIKDLGMVPVERDNLYRQVQIY
ncbi:cyclic dehypoxanthinyl futalosine synthase [Thermoplasma sp.]|uniref:cyclic dehypoxanthinyl futalosine synthase n=1 Tax=Thermoplasma sp. TaxID=1973142 RepID=UPI002627052C|nr:cyclic dehypoxanthinyl futalosine synthase [Thermoplasma sp.]